MSAPAFEVDRSDGTEVHTRCVYDPRLIVRNYLCGWCDPPPPPSLLGCTTLGGGMRGIAQHLTPAW